MKRFVTLLASSLLTCAASAAEKPAHSTRDTEGWTLRVDDRLVNGSAEAMAEHKQFKRPTR